jgi:hypothetical protein
LYFHVIGLLFQVLNLDFTFKLNNNIISAIIEIINHILIYNKHQMPDPVRIDRQRCGFRTRA